MEENESVTEAMVSTLIRGLRYQGRVNRQFRTVWEWVALPLSAQELDALFRGLVTAEKLLRWPGGSVAGAIWVYRALHRRNIGLAQAAADWAIGYTKNPTSRSGKAS